MSAAPTPRDALLLDLALERTRLGLKGPRATDWLESQGLEVPQAPNSWSERSAGAAEAPLLIARLGTSEYFLEQPAPAPELAALERALDTEASGVYPVLREDTGLELRGAGVHAALAQVCNVEFAALTLGARPIVMTLMMGIAVLVIAQGTAGDPRYRIWCDPTYGSALIDELGIVIRESGGCVRGETQGESV
jgi:sarcosine oxidase subunit gamma